VRRDPSAHGPIVSTGRWLPVFGLIFLNLLVWGWTVRFGFVFDDRVNILANTWIRSPDALSLAFTEHTAGFNPVYDTSFYRPGMHLLYGAVYAVAGYGAWAFHLLNVALHLGNVLVVYALTGAIARRWGPAEGAGRIALAAALFFSVHPVHAEAIAWIAGITDLSYTFFGLLAFTAYVQAFRRERLGAVAGVLILIALFCKETAAVFIAVFAVLEWIEARSSSGWSLTASARRWAPTLSALVVYLTARLLALGSFAPSAETHAVGWLQLLTNGAQLFARYVGLLVAPLEVNAARFVPPDSGLGDPVVLAGVLLAVGLLVATFRYRNEQLVVLAIALGTFPILPVLYVPAIESGGSVFGERYLYLPVLGLGWAVGLALEWLGRRRRGGARAAFAMLAIGVLVGSVLSGSRSRIWTDSLTLWTDAARKSPDFAMAHEGLCFALYDAGRIPEALEACARALALDPSRVNARINHGTALLALGRPAEAKVELEIALARRPASPGALVNLGLACMVLGQPEEALASYRRAIEFDPDHAEAHNALGVALVRLGDPHGALPHLAEASRLAPHQVEYRTNLEFCRREVAKR
jgi:tetratricopeptide (TPR) repeat protein